MNVIGPDRLKPRSTHILNAVVVLALVEVLSATLASAFYLIGADSARAVSRINDGYWLKRFGGLFSGLLGSRLFAYRLGFLHVIQRIER